MSKLKKLNKLNKSKTLNVALSVGLVVSSLVTAVPAYAASSAPLSAHVLTVTNKVTTSTPIFSLYDPKDIDVTLTSASSLSQIKNGIYKLQKDIDYTQAGNIVTIKADYLKTQKIGTKHLKFDFDSGKDPSLSVSVKKTNPTISLKTAKFINKYQRPITVTMNPYGITFNGIFNGAAQVDPSNYTISNPSSSGSKKVTLKASYLSSLPNGPTTLNFDFAGGQDRSLSVTCTGNPIIDVKSIDQISVSTTVGVPPTLPATVRAKLSDDSDRDVSVTWDTIPQSKYASLGTFSVNGTVAGTTIKAVANVTVKDKDIIPNQYVITSLVGNAIPNLNTEGGKTLDNVVLLKSTAKLQAMVKDDTGKPVAGSSVTFNINSADTFSSVHLPEGPDPDSHKYVATAAFDNNQQTITAVTGSDGIATANLTANVTPNEAKTDKEIMTDKYAATEVTYNAAVNGVINTGAVSFATFSQNYFDHDVDVHVAVKNTNGASPIIGHTLGLYPFSDEGTRKTLNGLHDIEYAVGQQVSGISGTPDNTLKVSAELDLNVYSSLVDSNIQGNKSLQLTGSLTGINPNQTDVHTEANLVIPDRVNYATLHFNSMSLSRGTEVTVYFIPAGNDAPSTVDTTLAAQSFNGHFLSGGIWAKTFAVASNADSYVDNNFALQIPANFSKGTVYVVTQAPGQIDPATDIGYQLSTIDMNYGALATLVKADVGSYVNWSQVPQINYSQIATFEGADKARLVSILTAAGQTIDANWTFKYKVPVYPMVGDAIVQAYNGFNQVVKQWSMPTTNHLANGQINQNGLLIDYMAMKESPALIIPLATDADFTTPAQATLTQDNGTAYINSTHTGPQEIKGTLSIPGIPNNLMNSLATDVYSFAQWLPLPLDVGPLTVDNVQKTLTGQKVTLTAKVTDANGNLVQTNHGKVKFDIITAENNIGEISATGDIKESHYVENDGTEDTDTVTGTQPYGKHRRYVVQTDTNGIATLTLSAPDVASVIAQASAAWDVDPKTGEMRYYSVALNDDAGAVSANGKLTQIDFGSLELLYVPEQGQGSGNIQDYSPTKDPQVIKDANSSAVVGNAQNFGILSSITWPVNPVFDRVSVNNCCKTVQGLTAPADVKGIPFTVRKVDGSVGDVNQVSSSSDTNQSAAGLTQWTAISDKSGQETILVEPKVDAASWNNIQLVSGITNIVDAGTGLVTPVNKLTIPINWRVGMGAAVVSVPSNTANTETGTVPIKVKVTDVKGNPIAGEAVRFTLTKSAGGTATLDFTKLKTNANGEAIATLSGGIDGEQDGITVVVEDLVTGTTLPITNGQQNIVWQKQVAPLSYDKAVPDTTVNPNKIILTFNHDVNPNTVDPSGSQFVVTDNAAGTPNTYALQSAVVNGSKITLTLASSNSVLGFYNKFTWNGDFTVTINKIDTGSGTLQVGDNYNSVIDDGTSQSFTIPQS